MDSGYFKQAMDPFHPHEAIKKSTDQYSEALKTHCGHQLDIYIGTTKEEISHSHDLNVFVDL